MCIFDGMRTCATRKYKRLKLRSPQILFFCWTSVQFGVQSVVEELVCDPQIYSCWRWNSVSKSSISKTSLKNRDCEMIHNIMKSFLYICKNIAIYNPLISDIIPWYSITPCFFFREKKTSCFFTSRSPKDLTMDFAWMGCSRCTPVTLVGWVSAESGDWLS